MKRNNFFIYIIYIFFFTDIMCQKNKKEELSSCNSAEESKNKFILKTDLSQKELEQILLNNFTMPINNNKKKKSNERNKKNINENVKEFKSKDTLNKTILLIEVNNITELNNESISNKKTLYELIDAKENNETKIFLSFDKFFTTQYKEMFNYTYTILIFFLILIIIIIYYAFILPNEAPDWNINSPVATNASRTNRNINFENNYILKDNDI